MEGNNLSEFKKHRQSMEDLCRILELPWEKISPIYVRELKRMQNRAKIREYLPVLVSRHVKDILRKL
ncbi:MAG: hypothetical protein A4E70_01979 [Syntrophus sp. PtaU1.Bin005]|nr:MAG: hypothetical protein A4E70_01979 [Syntrophus sp. PtaU1.Bin005]